MAPGQRARRLLENRAREWQDGKTGHALDSIDLATVMVGAPGMRAWDAVEKANEKDDAERRLIAASRREHARRRLIRRVSMGVLAAVLAAFCVTGAIAWIEWGIAEKETIEANKQTGIAAEKTAIAQEKTRIAEENLRIATSRQLAALSMVERSGHIDRSLLLAVEALDRADLPEARGSLYTALQERPGLESILHCDEGSVHGMAISPDGQTIAGAYIGPRNRSGVVLWKRARRRAKWRSISHLFTEGASLLRRVQSRRQDPRRRVSWWRGYSCRVLGRCIKETYHGGPIASRLQHARHSVQSRR